MCRRIAAASAMCSRMRGCFRISMCAQNLDYGRRMNRLADDPAQQEARHRPARHRPSARPPSRKTLRRRAAARRARPRAVVKAATAAARRAARLARRGPQGRDHAVPGAAARRGQCADGLCQPRRRRNAPACDPDRDAAQRTGDGARRGEGAGGARRLLPRRHCEERSDEAIQLFARKLDCFARSHDDGETKPPPPATICRRACA